MVNQKKETTTAKPMKGNYTYVGLDIDTTGRRLIDEVSSLKVESETTFANLLILFL